MHPQSGTLPPTKAISSNCATPFGVHFLSNHHNIIIIIVIIIIIIINFHIDTMPGYHHINMLSGFSKDFAGGTPDQGTWKNESKQ